MSNWSAYVFSLLNNSHNNFVTSGLLQSGKVRGKRIIFTLVKESQEKSGNFVKSQGRISKSQGNFFSPSGYLYSPLTLIF